MSTRERPILMSAPMVRALLSGTKTVTRRIVKPQPEPDKKYGGYHWPSHQAKTMVEISEMGGLGPHGGRGDRLWVKEAIALSSPWPEGKSNPGYDSAIYVADESPTLLDTWPWKRDRLPGMFMPRGLSRITLKVTAVRVERLHDITEEQAKAEGVERDTSPCDHTRISCEEIGCMGPTYRSTFAELWMDINGTDSWAANPWVWVVSFKRVTP